MRNLETVNMNNVFLSNYKTPFETFPFDKIDKGDYIPAFKAGIEKSVTEIDEIINNIASPTFKNTIEALENSGELLNRVESIFFNLLNVESNDQMQKIAEEVSSLLSEHSNYIFLNPLLFKKIQFLYNSLDKSALSEEQKTLLHETYQSFVRNGACLNADQKAIFKEIKEKLSLLEIKFGQNLLNATNSFSLLLTDVHDLEGLPDYVIEEARDRAIKQEKQGYEFNLSYPCYSSVMKYAVNRDFRHKIYTGYNTNASSGEYDNSDIVKKIVNYRLRIAQLLGYKNYASYKLENRMAQSESNVSSLLNQLLNSYKPWALKEFAEISNYAKEKDSISDFSPWDWSFYSNKVKTEKFNYNDEMTRPYFELNKVKMGVFDLANKLYGLNFKLNKDIPIYNSEVEAYEVYDNDDTFLAILYIDYFPRASKQNGAWMSEIRCQRYNSEGKRVFPQILIAMNLTKPTSSQPSLLSVDEVSTFLHEFGHSLHGMLSNTKYASLSGTNVYRDFVELPSQLLENWAIEKPFIDTFAKHYVSKKCMPEELIEKIKNNNNFNIGYSTLRQLCFGYLDMAWHSIEDPFEGEIYDFEKEVLKNCQLISNSEFELISTHFSHIFDGGYAAGYYSYKWAEVLDADAYSLFQEKGFFDKEAATKFRKCILEKGGTEHPLKLYIDFRGKEPEIKYLLHRHGIIND